MALNSMGEWNRCEIPRLTLELDNRTVKDYGEDSTLQEEEIKEWVRKKNSSKEMSQKKIEKLKARTISKKHSREEDDLRQNLEDDQPAPKKKKRLHDLVTGWGDKKGTTLVEQPAIGSYQPLEQRLLDQEVVNSHNLQYNQTPRL